MVFPATNKILRVVKTLKILENQNVSEIKMKQ